MRIQRVRRIILSFILGALVLIGVGFVYTPSVTRAECGVYHTVQSGQNLFRISLRYGVSIGSIAAANGIANVNRIFVGQSLYIPCNGSTTSTSGYILVSVTPAPFVAQPNALGTPPSTDCTGFVATSPDGFTQEGNTFYWDPPRNFEAARYQVRILNDKGANVGSYETLAPNTKLQGDTSIGSIGEGTNFYWYVVAVTADNRICQTPTRYAQREWPKPDPTVTPTPTP